MADGQEYGEEDPRHHTVKLKEMLNDAALHAREIIEKVADPRGKVCSRRLPKC